VSAGAGDDGPMPATAIPNATTSMGVISHAPVCPLVLQRVADAIDDGRWFDEHLEAATRIRRSSAAELAELRVLADVRHGRHQ
jgi:hypothetical protein